MFLGHFGLAFAAKPAAARVSLGTSFMAAQLADLIWPPLVVLGLERVEVLPGATAVTPLDFVSYPYSHSLLALVFWGALFGIVYFVWARSRAVAALVLGLLVVSHWALDALTHRPDMPLTIAGPTRVGLGLWNSVPGTLAVELLIFAVGLTLYRRATVARDRTGSIALSSLVVFLLVAYATALFGPLPPNGRAAALSAGSMWLLVGWAFWIDRHRTPLSQ